MDGQKQAVPAAKPKSGKTLTDFGAMGDLLSSIEKKTEKQVNHQKRMVQGKREKVSALDRDKERLEKIGNMQAFTDNTLDNLFLHVSNTVASKQTTHRKSK